MAQILTDGPVYRTTETAGVIDAPSRRVVRYGGRNSIIVIVVLMLLLAWMYTTRGFASLGFGVNQGPAAVTWPSDVRPTVEPTIAVTNETYPVPLPATPLPVPADVRVTDQATPVQLPGTGTTVYTTPEILGTARVAGDNVNMRTGPSENYRAAVVLPRGWEVYVMRQSHIDNYGEVWIEVSVRTDQGMEKGWINRRYLAMSGY